MHEHAATGTVLLGVMDGHGEAGDLVSHYVAERIAPRVFRHAEFASAPTVAIAEVGAVWFPLILPLTPAPPQPPQPLRPPPRSGPTVCRHASLPPCLRAAIPP
jgi:hypothetical protein